MAINVSILLYVLVGNPALAESTSPLEIIEYQAPPGCPGQQDVEQRVLMLIKWDSDSSYDNVQATITISQNDSARWRLVLHTVQAGNNGRRRLKAPSCEALTRSAALVIALMLDPELSPDILANVSDDKEGTLVPESDPSPSGDPARQPTKTPADGSSDALTENETEPKSPVAIGISIGPALDLGTIAGASFGILLGAGMRFHGFGVDGVAVLLVPRKIRVDDSAAPGGRLWRVGGGLGGSWAYSFQRVAIGAYAHGELGAINGQGVGVPTSREIWKMHLAFGGGLMTSLAVGKNWILKGNWGVLFPVNRRRYYIENIGNIHETPPVLGRFSIVLEWLL